ncbi:MAG: class I SAM-dependent methyltransferase [Patescibacteria group bacterium]|nr:class I SAM-dependent methyltransferase [Patescibacteria group bacterium]
MNTYFISGEQYDIQYQGYQEDLKFYLSEIKKANSTLEIGCGTGRILLLALKKGYKIEGLDGSKSMLKKLKEKAKKENLEPKTYFADMKNFKLDKKYNLIIVPFRTFLHLDSVQEQKESLKNFYRHLKKNGRLILNFFNPDYKRMSFQKNKKEFHSIVKDPVTKNKIKIYAINHYYPANQTIKTKFIHEEVDKNNLLLNKKEYNLKLKYIFRFEFEHLLTLMKFKPLKLYGSFKRRKFTDESREMIWIAKKT